MPSAQFAPEALYLFLVVLLFGFVYIGISHFHQRYRIQRWIKAFTAANKARLAGRLEDAHRHLQDAMAHAAQLPRHWKIRSVTTRELAALLGAKGKYAEAERLHRNDLVLHEKFDGPRAPDTAITTSNLATVLDDTGKHAEAEPLHRQAVQFLEQFPGFASETANAINSYARCLFELGRFDEARDLFRRSMTLAQQAGKNSPLREASSLSNLAVVSNETAHYAEAEALHRQVLATREGEAGPESLAIHDKVSGGTSLNAAHAANHMADVKFEQSRFPEAAALLNKSLEVREAKLPPGHAHLAFSLHGLARLAERQGQPIEAESFYQRTLAIREAALPSDHPHLAKLLEDYAGLLVSTNRPAEAAQLAAQARAARESHAANEASAQEKEPS